MVLSQMIRAQLWVVLVAFVLSCSVTNGTSVTGEKIRHAEKIRQRWHCLIHSKINEIEDELNSVKSSTEHCSCDSSNSCPVPDKGVLDKISKLESKVTALRKSLENKKISTIAREQRVQELNNTILSLGSGGGSRTCSSIKVGGRYLGSYLVRVNSNIFMGKPAKTSSNYYYSHFERAFDGDFRTHSHSKKEKNPWILVDLQVRHFIWEIRVTFTLATGAKGMRVYVSDDPTTFFKYDKLDIDSLHNDNLFGALHGDSPTQTVTLRSPDGMCGRYVLLYREVQKEFMIVYEMQGTGYVYE